ncbi:MAG: class I SAM-dependent methyltransferase [Candidatus Saccharibacteria bacterium]
MAEQMQRSILESVLNSSSGSSMSRQRRDGYQTLTGRRRSAIGLLAHTAALNARELAVADLDIAIQEDLYAICGINEALKGKELCETPLLSWPVHKGLIDRHGRRLDGGHALIIGADSPFSARAFECLAKEEYGAARAHIVDIKGGKDKTRHGTFVYGSGTQLPYRSGSMDLVQTNQLLHMIEDPTDQGRSRRELTGVLLSEVSRVLAPGGQLVMREMTFNAPCCGRETSEESSAARVAQLGSCIMAAAAPLDFDKFIIEPTHQPEGYDYLTDPSRDFSSYNQIEMGEVLSVYASKSF